MGYPTKVSCPSCGYVIYFNDGITMRECAEISKYEKDIRAGKVRNRILTQLFKVHPEAILTKHGIYYCPICNSITGNDDFFAFEVIDKKTLPPKTKKYYPSGRPKCIRCKTKMILDPDPLSRTHICPYCDAELEYSILMHED